MAFFHLGKGTWEHERDLRARELGRSVLESSWPWAAEEGQQLMWILGRETKENCCMAGKQAEKDSMQGKGAGLELHTKTIHSCAGKVAGCALRSSFLVLSITNVL